MLPYTQGEKEAMASQMLVMAQQYLNLALDHLKESLWIGLHEPADSHTLRMIDTADMLGIVIRRAGDVRKEIDNG